MQRTVLELIDNNLFQDYLVDTWAPVKPTNLVPTYRSIMSPKKIFGLIANAFWSLD